MNAPSSVVVMIGMSLLYMAYVVTLFAYAVFHLGFSGWWFLPAALFASLGSVSTKTKVSAETKP